MKTYVICSTIVFVLFTFSDTNNTYYLLEKHTVIWSAIADHTAITYSLYSAQKSVQIYSEVNAPNGFYN